ncbi:MAG: MEDS domain-containing protein [Haliea sp.]|nr:MEDS domain-containing protein [Haliea sp.]
MEDQTASAVAFIAAGLHSGERCIYVANDSPFEELVPRFTALGVNVAEECDKGSLKILTKHDVYLREGSSTRRGCSIIWRNASLLLWPTAMPACGSRGDDLGARRESGKAIG